MSKAQEGEDAPLPSGCDTVDGDEASITAINAQSFAQNLKADRPTSLNNEH
jgi:hypothetical protein